MTMDRPAYPRIATLSLVLLAVAATTAATRTPHPRALRATPSVAQPNTVAAAKQIASPMAASPVVPVEQTRKPVARQTQASVPTASVAPQSPAPQSLALQAVSARKQREGLTLDEIRALVRQYYPSVLAGDTSIAMITFIVDANHRYLMSQTSPNAPDQDWTLGEMSQGRGGRGGGAGWAYAMNDSVKAERMAQVVAAAKEKLETLQQRRVGMDSDMVVVRGRGAAQDNAAADSALVMVKLALAKAQAESGAQGVQANVKEMLKMLREQSGVTWSGVTLVQSRFAAGSIGPRAIVIVAVELQQ